jgi:hypothetical protein
LGREHHIFRLAQSVSLGVSIIRAELANYTLTVNLSSGDDTLSASSGAGVDPATNAETVANVP